MKKRFRQLLSLVLSCALMSSLAACGGETSSSASNSDGSVSSLPADDGTVSGTLEIQYFVGGYGSAWWEWLVEAFQEEYPDVEVVVNAGSDINETMTTRWISGNPPI